MLSDLSFNLPALRAAYASGITPEAVIAEALDRIERAGDPGIFIHLAAREALLAEARALGAPDGRPLWGMPFAVKDNIDVAGMPTTAACPEFAYIAETEAFVVARLRAAGAICLGKTNLDQFATGLVGLRTPYPVPRNALDPAIVPGGSSSGSAVAVARGIAAFALGTDTAGSGRVPAALNDLVGLKPTLGLLSASGVVPACRTLDTVSIFARSVADAWDVLAEAAAYDPADSYSRPVALCAPEANPAAARVGAPDAATLETFGDSVQRAAFEAALERCEAAGAQMQRIDFTPFFDVARLLYEGPWLAERTAAVGARLTEAPESLHPVTRSLLEQGAALTAVDAFEGFYRLQALKRTCAAAMEDLDLLCVPTIPTFVTVAEVEREPIGPNSRLGTYTNFVNLLDLCGIAVPVGARSDGRPGSVTLLARSGEDHRAAALAMRIERDLAGGVWRPRPLPAQAGPGELALAVCGAHMAGLPLNPALTSRGGRFLREARTAPSYRLHALAGGPPARPGLVRSADGDGAAIALEVWALPGAAIGALLAEIPWPLGLGTIELEDGSRVHGFVCEGAGLSEARDISAFGGWRAYLAQTVKAAE